MLPGEISRFERARRQLRPEFDSKGRFAFLRLATETALQGLTLLIQGDGVSVESEDIPTSTHRVERYGRNFTGTTIDLNPKGRVELKLACEALSEAAA